MDTNIPQPETPELGTPTGKNVPSLEEFAKKNKMSIATDSDGIQSIVKETPVGSIKITAYIGSNNKVEYKYTLEGGPTVNLASLKKEDKKFNEPSTAFASANSALKSWEGFVKKNVDTSKSTVNENQNDVTGVLKEVDEFLGEVNVQESVSDYPKDQAKKDLSSINYYKGQLAGVKTDGEYASTIKIHSAEGGQDTKFMNLNKDSAEVLVKWLTEKYIK
jgi:hypothetical protein